MPAITVTLDTMVAIRDALSYVYDHNPFLPDSHKATAEKVTMLVEEAKARQRMNENPYHDEITMARNRANAKKRLRTYIQTGVDPG